MGQKKKVQADDDTKQTQIFNLIQRLCSEHVNGPPPTNVADLWSEHLKIREIIEQTVELHGQISTVDADLTGPQQRSKASIEKFLTWCNEQGIKTDGVTLEKVDNGIGLGLVATQAIDKGQVVIEVPRPAMLSYDRALKSSYLKKAFERDLLVQQMDNVGLALMLCCERLAPRSPWQAYLNVLPSSFTTPMCFTVEQLQSLRPSPLYEKALLLYRAVVRQYAYFFMIVAKNVEFDNDKKNSSNPPLFYNSPLTVGNFTFSLYRWAVCSVATRVNFIPSDNLKTADGVPKMVPALIPMLDMPNHSVSLGPDNQAVSFCAEDECAQVLSAKDVGASEPLLIFYGRRSNADFLQHNGFVPEEDNSAHDSYLLRLGVNKSEKHASARLDRILKLGFGGTAQTSVFLFELTNDNPPYKEELSEFVRILVASEPTDEEINCEKTAIKAREWLRTRIAILLAAYPKVTPSDDFTSTMVARLHSGEKKILNGTLDYLTTA